MTILSHQDTTQATQRWAVDPARSTVEFRVKGFWGLTTVAGHFSRFDGSYTVAPDGRAVELIVDAGSLDTGNRRRDEHLRSSDFFDVEPHPHVRFTRMTSRTPTTVRCACEASWRRREGRCRSRSRQRCASSMASSRWRRPR